MSKYSVLETFRANTQKLRDGIASGRIKDNVQKTPEAVEDLFKQFLREGATEKDILDLLWLLANDDRQEWDSIAHYFL